MSDTKPIIPPSRNESEEDIESLRKGNIKSVSYRSNADLIPNAGKVELDPSQPFGMGIINDIKRTIGSHWKEEMTIFNQKTVAVSLLMFITVIAPTLTFGAIYGTSTGFSIGAVETILATAWTGCFFALFSGMPMAIMGSTGPSLIMTTVIYEMSKTIDVPFLTFHAWISVWTFLYTTLTALFDLTRYVKLATKFTDDIFALLIVSIFILNAFGSPFGPGGLLRYLDPDNKSHSDFQLEYGDEYIYLKSAILSILIGLACTATIFALRALKASPFLCNQTIRNSCSDFSVTVAVIIWSVLKNVCFPTVKVEELNVPESFEPTYTCCNAECTAYFPDECLDVSEPMGKRSWFADMMDLNGKPEVIGIAAGPALLAFILFYLDNGITWHLIYSPRNGLQHGDSYNWDLFLNGFCNLINGLLGLPWLVATTVPCIVHIDNLTEKDKNGNIISVQENRLTYLFSHLLVGLSLLFLPAMKLVPMPVLLGVFLFMGLSSIGRIDFWNRFLLFFQQPSRYAKTPFNKYMKLSRVHLYTVLQCIFFAGVFMVQNTKSIAIAFPFMTLACIPGRLYLLPKIFEGWELLLLDGEEEEIERFVEEKESVTITVHSGHDNNDGEESDE